jgi:hypothetical protein
MNNVSQELHEIARKEEGKLLLELMAAVYEANRVSGKVFYLDYHGHVEGVGVRIAESKSDFNNYLFDEWISGAYSYEYRWNKMNEWLSTVNKYIAEAEEVSV